MCSENAPVKICLRCASELSCSRDSRDGVIDFFDCPECHSRYAQAPGQCLHDRWLMPLTLPLYMVMFDQKPVEKAEFVAQAMMERGPGFAEVVLEHVNEELARPKQKVREIHDLVCKDEALLRKFLKQFSQELTILLQTA